ncbi:Hsp20/alpha crystallin family protein [Desulfohalovibrio reitneri]|jgi:HSP20 family protein|uniref:Hsp20/alpha crystallin family protein n=1 Tax=Desulfohalovibrio reitneri TaxID=1307759 RepID=UPI0004A6B61F|nr:Hsp20/alpha crystallin family protein [Desulfohalovibrio reitneri]
MAKTTRAPWMGLIEDLGEQMDDMMREPRRARRDAHVWQPQADIFETAENITLQVELPGVAREDIRLEVKNRTLWLYGERRFEKDAGETVYHQLERSYGAFARKFSLPGGADPDTMRAHLREGLLTVVIPKRPRDTGRRIQVNCID